MKITIVAIKRQTFEIKGDKFGDALDTFIELHPDWEIETVDDRQIWGWCEVSGKPIFEDDDFVEDQDCIKILKSELG